MIKTIAFLNQKGGVGKTTSSVNLSIGLGKMGYKVLEIDLDPQANSSDYFCEDKENYCYIDQVLEGTEAIIYQTSYPNVSFIPSRLDLALTERNILLSSKAQHNRLYKALKNTLDQFDFIIIDCPPILNLLTVNALYICSDVIIPIKIDKAAEKGFRITLQNIKEIAESYDLDIDYNVLFTMVHRSKIDREKIKVIGDECRGKIIQTTIRHQEKPITEAGYKKSHVVGGNTGVGNDYELLTQELVMKWDGEKHDRN